MLIDPRIKRLFIGCLVLVVVIFGITQVYHYLTTGKLTVATNRKNSYIRLFDQNNHQIGESTQSQKLSKRLKPGRYSVATNDGSAYTDKVVDVEARQKTSLNLQLNAPRTPEPVLGGAVFGVAAGSTALYFVGPSTGDVSKIDDQGNITTVDDAHIYKKARWASPGTGLIMDDSHNLYTVVNSGVATPLALPFPVNNNPSIDFDIAPNGNLYVSNGQDVYAGSLSGNFTKIYSSGSNYNSGLAAGKTGVAFIEKNPENNSTSIVVVRSGKQKKITTAASQLAWSPDGKYLAASRGKNAGVIYNDSLEPVYTLPNQGIANAIWPNEKSLIYAVGNVVWLYSLANQQSQAIGTLSANQSISGAAVSNDQSYLYFSGSTQLLRLGLGSRTVNSNLVALGAFLPESVGICSLDYVNFIKPVITIQYPHLEGNLAQCVIAARSQLHYYGLNPDEFQYVMTEPDDYTAAAN